MLELLLRYFLLGKTIKNDRRNLINHTADTSPTLLYQVDHFQVFKNNFLNHSDNVVVQNTEPTT